MCNSIKLTHGNGGKDTSIIIKEIFHKHFSNNLLINSLDAAVFEVGQGKLAFTTDSFVVKPLFFSGGDIGKLAVCGTINDLVVSGAMPLYLSCGFIIEEGFSIDLLEKIAESMGEMCKETGVKIIAGDTKVVEKGSVDGLFINTSGIGMTNRGYELKPIKEGDRIIVTGGIGEHGTTIAIERYEMKVKGDLKSDCMPLNNVIVKLKKYENSIKLMKDPTRGGLATALNEVAEFVGKGIHLLEEQIPIKKEVVSINQLIGLDPLYLACEGRMILVVDQKESQSILKEIRQCEGCEDAAIIGSFINCRAQSIVFMETHIGGKRIIGPLEGAMLPRIC
ncbi:hydrogenase expression/formation protein HypE [Clostridium sp. Cult2]|uniref:hydrogenase expression/formation protein HypE n=1 Tax=Clostridium sp. Cult2 TaxID=2079003 RepID=UPI001F16EB98|nr:hydrogenase expression/formation protein HypE [Clostridium sp. Cult2]MCF6465164.1 hydrogenase expression/formation protein HypE [Clostridium sp. Cult2]